MLAPVIASPRRRSLAIVFVASLLTACGGGGSDSSDGPATTVSNRADARWTINGFDYIGASAALGDADGFSALVVSTAGIDSALGAWAGSAVSVSYTSDGAGAYTLLPFGSSILGEEANDPAGRYATLNISVGTQNTDPPAATVYVAESGSLRAVLDDDGRYVFTSEGPVVLTQQTTLGDGVAGAPATVEATLTDIGPIPF